MIQNTGIHIYIKGLAFGIVVIGIALSWILGGIELALANLLVVEILFWILDDWFWVRKRIQAKIDTRFGDWVERLILVRGRIFIAVCIWWRLHRPAVAFTVLVVGGLSRALWRRRMRGRGQNGRW